MTPEQRRPTCYACLWRFTRQNRMKETYYLCGITKQRINLLMAACPYFWQENTQNPLRPVTYAKEAAP
jgi:hypothetical protein